MNEVLDELISISEEKWRHVGRELENGKSFCEIDNTIATTLQNLTAVSNSLRNTWGNKKRQRNELRSMICRYGKPIVWFTICPAQHQNPLVLKLGSIPDELAHSIQDRVKFCIEDPVACTEFFHLTIRHVLKILKLEVGMDQHYGVIEAQMRGTLHLHLIGWNSNHKTRTEEEWIRLADEVSSAETSDTSLSEEDINNLLMEFPSEVRSQHEIIENSKVLCQSKLSNLHDFRHRKSCFKKSFGVKLGTCRYKFPRPLQSMTCLKEDGIELKRNNAYINTYNPLIMNIFRCNHDIKILPDLPSDDLLALLYYLTNYTTKLESSNYSVCEVAATARQELMKELENPSSRKYADRLFIRILNKITGKNEISSNLVVNELLGYPEEYCSQNFKTLNYGLFLRILNRQEFDVQLRIPKNRNDFVNEEDLDEDYMVDSIVVTNLYEDYINRGEALAFLSLYQYVSRVYKKKISTSVSTSGYKFTVDHPQKDTHIQVLLSNGNYKVPKLVGPATFKFTEIEYIKLLLILFKPWKDINFIRNQHYDTMQQFMECVSIDSDANLYLLHNFTLLQKSKLAADKKRFENESNINNGVTLDNRTSGDGELLVGGTFVEDQEDEDSNSENEDFEEDEDVEALSFLNIPEERASSDKIHVNMIQNLGIEI